MPPTQNEFPQPANARPPAGPTSGTLSQPANLGDVLRAFNNQQAFRLDPDLKLALEDMAGAAMGAKWREGWFEWLSQMVNDSLRNYMGQ